MQQIRRNVFETNSSSCHSLSILKDVDNQSLIQPTLDMYNDLIVNYKYYGWTGDDICSCNDKIDYLWAHFARTRPQYGELARETDFIDFLKSIYPQINDVIFNYDNQKPFGIDNNSCDLLDDISFEDFLTKPYIVIFE